MACNLCGEKVDVCENCINELKHRFYCFEEIHFCSESCWREWLLEEEEKKLMQAINLD